MKFTSLVLLITCLSTVTVVNGSMEAFQQSYQAYQAAMQAKDWSGALSAANNSLKHGLDEFDDAGDNVANLRLNYARELTRNKQYEEAETQLELSLAAKSDSTGEAHQSLTMYWYSWAKSAPRLTSNKPIPILSERQSWRRATAPGQKYN